MTSVSRTPKTRSPNSGASAAFAVFCVMVLIGTEIVASAAMLDAVVEMVVPNDGLLAYGVRALVVLGAVATLCHAGRLMFPVDPVSEIGDRSR